MLKLNLRYSTWTSALNLGVVSLASVNLFVCLFSSFFYDMWWKLSPLNCYFFSSRIFVLELDIICQNFYQHLLFLSPYLCNYFKVFLHCVYFKNSGQCVYIHTCTYTHIFLIHTHIFHRSYHITNNFLGISVWVIHIVFLNILFIL